MLLGTYIFMFEYKSQLYVVFEGNKKLQFDAMEVIQKSPEIRLIDKVW